MTPIIYIIFHIATSPFVFGFISKFFFLFGIKSQRLEKMRIKYVQHNPDKKSDIIIVSIAGGALRIGGIPQPELQKTLEVFKVDQLFLCDPTGMTYYFTDPNLEWNGYEYHKSLIEKYLEGYKKSLFIATCMAASTALMYSNLCTNLICFNPQVSLVKENRWKYWIAGQMMPKDLRDRFESIINDTVMASTANINVHVSNDQEEIFQASMLHSNAKITIHKDCSDHALPMFLRKDNRLFQLIQTEVDLMKNL